MQNSFLFLINYAEPLTLLQYQLLNNSSWSDCLILVVIGKTVFINLCLFLKKNKMNLKLVKILI